MFYLLALCRQPPDRLPELPAGWPAAGRKLDWQEGSQGGAVFVRLSAPFPPWNNQREKLQWWAEHQRMINELGATNQVVPCQVGCGLEDEAQWEMLLETNRAFWQQAWEALDGRQEWNLTVRWADPGQLPACCAGEPEVVALREALAGRVLTEQEVLDAGRLVARVADRIRQNLAAQIQEQVTRLTPCVVATAGEEDSIIHLACLLRPDRVSALEELLHRGLKQLWPQGELRARLVGPLPPHSFATVQVICLPGQALQAALQRLGLSGVPTYQTLLAAKRRALKQVHPDMEQNHGGQVQQVLQDFALLESYYRMHGYRVEQISDGVLVRAVAPGARFIWRKAAERGEG